MIAAPTSQLRALAFGDPQAGPEAGEWGLIWGDGTPVVVLGSGGDGGEALTVPVPSDSLDSDRLTVGDLTVEVETLQECAVAAHDPDGDSDGDSDAPELMSVRICRLTGTRRTVAGDQPVDWLGLGVTQAAPVLAQLDSFRLILAWFGDDDALAVSSARPRRTSGHDKDEMIAAMFERSTPLAIDEARLSTTYARDGVAARMTLELWTTDGESDFPWRAAGEATAAPSIVERPGLRLEVIPMRCHRAGREGIGVYLLARAG